MINFSIVFPELYFLTCFKIISQNRVFRDLKLIFLIRLLQCQRFKCQRFIRLDHIINCLNYLFDYYVLLQLFIFRAGQIIDGFIAGLLNY